MFLCKGVFVRSLSILCVWHRVLPKAGVFVHRPSWAGRRLQLAASRSTAEAAGSGPFQ